MNKVEIEQFIQKRLKKEEVKERFFINEEFETFKSKQNIKIIESELIDKREVRNKEGILVQKMYKYKVKYVSYSLISYEELISLLIKKKYNTDSELAIIRQQAIKKSEFDEYFDYVENCKKLAKDFVLERGF